MAYLNRIIKLNDHSLQTMGEVYGTLEHLKAIQKLDILALNPDAYFESYIRENLRNISEMELQEAGHDIFPLRYSLIIGVPVFCLGTNTSEEDISKIIEKMESERLQNLVSLIEGSNVDFFRLQFKKQGVENAD